MMFNSDKHCPDKTAWEQKDRSYNMLKIIERNEYSCYTMLSSEIPKLCCLWACLDQESYRRSRKNVDCS